MPTSPEAYLISAILKKQDHVTPASKGITQKFFHAYPDEWAWIEKYITLHKRAPSTSAFKKKFPAFPMKKADDVEYFCDEVRNSHAQSRLTESVQDVISLIERGDVQGAVRSMHHNSLDIETQMEGISGDADIFQNYDDIYTEFVRRRERAKSTGQAGLPTGFPTLDERTGGPQPGHVWIVAARLGQGKTWSLVRMACAQAFSGFSVQYNALEGTRAEIAMRVHTFASSEYGKQLFKALDLTMGKNLSPRDYKEFLHSLKSEVAGKMHVADASKGLINMLSIAAQIERNQPDAVFLDYITLMEPEKDGWEGVSKLSRDLHNVASRYQVPMIAAAQLNRKAANLSKNALGGMEDLAESDAIGRDADVGIVMKQLSSRVLLWKCSKFRHGRDGFMWYTKFLPNTGFFEEVTRDEALDVISEDEENEEEDATFTPRKVGSFKEMGENRRKALEKHNPKGRKVVRRK